MQGIYRIKNTTKDGYFYIGSAVDIEERWGVHRWALRNHRHENEKLQRAWDKYGETSFVFEVIEEYDGPYKNLLLREDEHLSKLPPTAYNIRRSSYKKEPYSEETLKKISDGVKASWEKTHDSRVASLKRYRNSKEYRMKISEGCRRSWTDERKQRVHVTKRGRNNPNADKTIYALYNSKTQEEFVGCRSEFLRKNNLNWVGFSKILSGKWTHYKGWSIKSRTS